MWMRVRSITVLQHMGAFGKKMGLFCRLAAVKLVYSVMGLAFCVAMGLPWQPGCTPTGACLLFSVLIRTHH